MERLDVRGELLAVLEVKLFLPAFLGGTSGVESVCRGVAQDGGAELLVDQDAGLFLGHAARDGRLEAVVDHLLGGGNLGRLLGG